MLTNEEDTLISAATLRTPPFKATVPLSIIESVALDFNVPETVSLSLKISLPPPDPTSSIFFELGISNASVRVKTLPVFTLTNAPPERFSVSIIESWEISNLPVVCSAEIKTFFTSEIPFRFKELAGSLSDRFSVLEKVPPPERVKTFAPRLNSLPE